MVPKILAISGLAALSCCAGGGEFHLTASEVTSALGGDTAGWPPEEQAQAADPWFLAGRVIYAGAACRWIEPGRKARCRYGASMLMLRPGRTRIWSKRTAIFIRTARGWSFAN